MQFHLQTNTSISDCKKYSYYFVTYNIVATDVRSRHYYTIAVMRVQEKENSKFRVPGGWLTVVCAVMTLCNLWLLVLRPHWSTQSGDENTQEEGVVLNKDVNVPVEAKVAARLMLPASAVSGPEEEENLSCTDPLWCNVPLPEVSHYRFFDPPTDPKRWKKAQILASSGEQVLLREAIKVFPNQFDFLNGDRSFRPIQPVVDVFINEDTWYEPIMRKPSSSASSISDQNAGMDAKAIAAANARMATNLKKKRKQAPGEDFAMLLNSVPTAYDFRAANRAPVIELGYPVFKKEDNTFFKGRFIGGMYLSQEKIFGAWEESKHMIDTPFIAISVLNENWGFLSTVFPGRTANWSICRCEKLPRVKKLLKDFLDDEKTLMLIVSQHHNQSHPKILTLPRGLPLEWEATDKLIWDAMRYSAENIKRTTLLFASASSWGPSKCFYGWKYCSRLTYLLWIQCAYATIRFRVSVCYLF